jgi:hypothetical protein
MPRIGFGSAHFHARYNTVNTPTIKMLTEEGRLAKGYTGSWAEENMMLKAAYDRNRYHYCLKCKLGKKSSSTATPPTLHDNIYDRM